jgi:hypothetical protein
MIDRRRLLFGIASLIAAPAIVRAELIMPVKAIVLPPPRYPGELSLGRDLPYWCDLLKFDKDPSLWVVHRKGS